MGDLELSGYWKRRVGRRAALRGGAVAFLGLAGVTIAGCSGSSKSSTASSSANAPGSVASGAAKAPGAATATPVAVLPKRGGTLKLGSRAQPGVMDPHFGGGGFDERFEWFVYDNLVTFDNKGNANLDESLAQSMELPDKQTIVFKIRPNIKFHDGSVFDATSAKWNIDRSLDPSRSATAKPQFVHIKSVDVVDPMTVRFNLSQPDSTLVGALGGKGGMMVSRQQVEKVGDDQFARNPVGTGPFTFVSWRDTSDMHFKKNDSYWRKGPDGGPAVYLDQVDVTFTPDPVVIASSMQSGALDHIDEPAASIPDLASDKSITKQKFEGNGIVLLFWNHGAPPLDNVDFRRACEAAWDRQSWSNIFFGGDLRPADAVIPPGSWAYKAQPNHPSFDLAAAKASLDKSGVPDAQRTFKITGAGDVWGGANGVQLLVDSLAKAGIRVIYEPTVAGNHTLKATNGDATYQLVSSLSLRPDPDGWFSQLYRANSTYNEGFAATAGIEPLLDQAAASYDLNERNSIYQQVLKITSDQLYSMLPGLFRNGYQYSRSTVRGVRYGADGKARLAQLWLAS